MLKAMSCNFLFIDMEHKSNTFMEKINVLQRLLISSLKHIYLKN